MTPYRYATFTLPDETHNRVGAGSNKDQLTSNACTGFSTTSAAECFVALHGGGLVQFSARDNYFQSRKHTGLLGADVGSKGWAAVRTTETIGLALESEWTFCTGWGDLLPCLNIQPPTSLNRIKARWDGVTYDSPSACVREMKYALAEKMPITASAKLMWDYDSPNYRGVPAGEEPAIYHQLTVLDYCPDGWIVENSVGGTGFFTLPYVATKDLYGICAVRQVGGIRVMSSDPDSIDQFVKPWIGDPSGFDKYAREVSAQSPAWAAFFKYLNRWCEVEQRNLSAEAAVEYCANVLGFNRVADLAALVNS